jgi:hypothetical protein
MSVAIAQRDESAVLEDGAIADTTSVLEVSCAADGVFDKAAISVLT